MLGDARTSSTTWPFYSLLGRGLASCLRIARRPLGYLRCQVRWAPFPYYGRSGALLNYFFARLFAKIVPFFYLGQQKIVLTLQMFNAILQFPHLSCLLLLFLLHVLTSMKKLVFRGLDHQVVGHCSYVRRIRCEEGNLRSYWW